MDGFRWDYLDRYDAPTLNQIAAEGVRARRLIPVFPTKTFPNHYSAVTGLYPEHHGIISNTMYDPETRARFSISNLEALSDPHWWQGEPVWVTAERRGRKVAVYFWPGSRGTHPGNPPILVVPVRPKRAGRNPCGPGTCMA